MSRLHLVRRSRRLAISLLVIGAFVLGTTLGPGLVAAASTPFQQVIVVNPISSPVPVSGTVSVANLPATQSHISVDNTTGSAIPVAGTVSVGRPAAKPFIFTAADGSSVVSPDVPTGKLFMATYFSAVMYSNNSAFNVTDGACTLYLVPGGAFPDPHTIGLIQGSVATIVGSWSGNTQMSVPLNSGDDIRASCLFSGSQPASTVVEGVLGGYFVPAS